MPSGRKDIAKDGKATQFPYNDPTKGGRKKKIYNVLKDMGYSKDDISSCFNELAFYSKKDIELILKKTDIPIIVQTIAKTYLEAEKNGDYSKVKDIVEQVVGKPKQTIDQKTIHEFEGDPFEKIRKNAGVKK